MPRHSIPMPTTPTSCRAAVSAASSTTSSRLPHLTRWRVTTCCRCCFSRFYSASASRLSAAKRASASVRSSTPYRPCCAGRWGLIVRLAPLGVLGAVAYTVGKYGVGSLKQLISLVALFYVSVAIFVFGVLGTVMALAGINIVKFLGYLREELTIVLATASSDAVLPQIMRKLERLGVKDSVVGLVIPTGYSFNLDAFSIYL